jgi:hypothetical protein
MEPQGSDFRRIPDSGGRSETVSAITRRTAVPNKTKVGYALSSEEHGPNDLVRNAVLAEQAGFDFVMVSDHFHPWIDRQEKLLPELKAS